MADTAVILNAKAGTIADRNPADVHAIVERAFADRGHSAEVVLASEDDFFAAIDRAAQSDAATIIVGGGDGSVSHAIGKLAGTDKSLGVLPLGTMNLFARSLGMPTDLEAAVTALAEASPKRIDLASVNGKIFHTLVGLAFFAEIARARAQVRGGSFPFGRFIAVARSSIRAFTRTGVLKLTLEAGGVRREIDAYALFASNNRLSANGFDRPDLDEGIIEIHFAEGAEMARRMQHGIDLIAGRWRDNPEIESIAAPRIRIMTRRPKLWVSVDGELIRMAAPLTIETMPRALSVLMPSKSL